MGCEWKKDGMMMTEPARRRGHARTRGSGEATVCPSLDILLLDVETLEHSMKNGP